MYEEKKNLNQNASESKKDTDIRIERIEVGDDLFERLKDRLGGILVDSMIAKFEGSPDRLLGFLIHRVGNSEPVLGHELDRADMYCDHDYYTFRFYDGNGKADHIAAHLELTVENLEDTVRKVLRHDQKTLRKIADEMADED